MKLPGIPGYYAEPVYVETYGKSGNITVPVSYEKLTYYINYELNGGSAKKLLTEYSVDTKESKLPVPTREGYRFTGWTFRGNAVEKVPVAGVLENITVTAGWEKLSYTLTYDYAGGTDEDPAHTNLPAEFDVRDINLGKVIMLPVLSKEGYTFTGWDMYAYETEEHTLFGTTGYVRIPNVQSDLKFTACFSVDSCNITFDMNDSADAAHKANNTANSITFFRPSEGSLIIKAPTREGYIFDGWKCDKKLGIVRAGTLIESVVLDSTNAVPNLTLTAQWRPQPYYINYNLKGGLLTLNKNGSVKVENGVPVAATLTNPSSYSIRNTIELEDPKRDEITFLGWTSAQFTELEYYTTATLSTADEVALISGKPVSTATVMTLLNAAAKEGNESRLESLKKQGITLTANWADSDYRIYYNLAGGKLPAGKENPSGYTNTTETITLVNPVKTGYEFVGWLEDGATGPMQSATIAKGSYGDKYFTAVWRFVSYSITYEMDGGSWTSTAKSGMREFSLMDSVIYIGENPGKPSSVFYNWTVKRADNKENLMTGVTGTLISVSELFGEEEPVSIIITANWTSEKAVMSIDLNGGEWPSDIMEDAAAWSPYYYNKTGQTVTLRDPEREGYDFAGWKVTGKNSVSVSASAKTGCHDVVIPSGTGDFELSAEWNLSSDIKYTVNYFIKEKNSEYILAKGETFKGTPGETITEEKLNELAKAFNGSTLEYSEAFSNGNRIAGETYTILADGSLELYLYLSVPLYYLIVHDREYESRFAYVEGEAVNEPVMTEWNGVTFGGWYEDKDFEKPYAFESSMVMPAHDVEVFAKWDIASYSIEYANWPEEIENPNPATYTTLTEDFYVVYPALDPDSTGYDYGLLTDEDMKKRTLVSTYERSGDMTVETIWNLHEFTITYPGGDHTYDGERPEKYTVKDSVTIPALVGESQTFLGWQAEIKGETVDLADNTIPEGTKGDITLIPVFDDECTITYHGLEGSNFEFVNPNPETYSKKGPEITLDNPSKEGYEFKYWQIKDGAAKSELTLPSEEIPGSVDITAVWEAITYTISGDDLLSPSTYTIEDTLSETGVVLVPATKQDYTFTGWEVTDEFLQLLEVGTDGKLPSGTFGDLTAVASYEYTGDGNTITYELVGGTKKSGVTYPDSYSPDDLPLTLPDSLERSGYTFLGWTMTYEGGVEPFATELMQGCDYGNITLTATWEADIYTIVYSGLDDYSSYAANYTVEDEIVLADPSKQGLTFKNWTAVFTATGESLALTGGNTIPKGTVGALCITANWDEGGQEDPFNPPSPHGGDDEGGGETGGDVTGDEKFNVLIYCGDGVSTMPFTGHEYDAGIIVNKEMLTSLITLADAGMVYSDIVWKEGGETVTSFTGVKDQLFEVVAVISYATLTITSNNENASYSGSGLKPVGTTTKLSTEPMDGYNFSGWWKSGEKVCDNLSCTVEVTGNASYEARYTERSLSVVTVTGAGHVSGSAAIPSYSVIGTAHASGSDAKTGTGTEVVRSGEKLTLIADADKFYKWQTESGMELSTAPEFTFTVTSSTTIVLVEKEEASTIVEFVGPGGQAVATDILKAGDAVSFPSSPAKRGYIFGGWSLNGNDTVTESDISQMIGTAECITVTALFTKDADKTCAVTVMIDGADTGLGNSSYVCGEIFDVTAPQEVDGKQFSCWASDLSGSEVLSFSSRYRMITMKDTTIYAIYGAAVSQEAVQPEIAFTSVYAEEADGRNKLTVIATRSGNENYELLEHGILYKKGVQSDMTVDDSEKTLGNSLEPNGSYTLHIDVTGHESEKISVRAYITVRDIRTGNILTFYSDIKRGSFVDAQ